MNNEIRHQLSDRIFHWVMAILTVILLATAFLPILGIKFDWVPIHWIAGVLLIFSVIFHLYRSFFVHGISDMILRWSDVTAIFIKNEIKEQKYDLGQKLYHWSIAVIMMILLVTGGCMLAKIDTPLWNRDPSIFSDWNWGIIYVLHGFASFLLIFFFILHIYFSFLPEHRELLRSMVYGKKKPSNQ